MKQTSFGKVHFKSVTIEGSYIVTDPSPCARFKETAYEWLESFIVNGKPYTVKRFARRTANAKSPQGISLSKGFIFEGERFPENDKAVIDRIIEKYGA